MITQTPGVYIREKNTYPASVAGVSTAKPAFIGFTEKAQSDPISITGMLDFETIFGLGYQSQFEVDQNTLAVSPDKRFMLADTLELYFRNGGGNCYIISIGTYDDFSTSTIIADFTDAIDQLDLKDDITLALIPDLHLQYTDGSGVLNGLSPSQFGTISGELVNKCAELKRVFALFDIKDMDHGVSGFRNAINPTDSKDLKYAAVYYPWLKVPAQISVEYDQITYTHSSTTAADIDALNGDLTLLDNQFSGVYRFQPLKDEMNALLKLVTEATQSQSQKNAKLTDFFRFMLEKVKKLVTLEASLNANSKIVSETQDLAGKPSPLHQEISKLYRLMDVLQTDGHIGTIGATYLMTDAQWSTFTGDNGDDINTLRSDTNFDPQPFTDHDAFAIDFIDGRYLDEDVLFKAISGLYTAAAFKKSNLEKILFENDASYRTIRQNIIEMKTLLPSQGAVAGLYCYNDRERGVWKSPANLALQGGVKPLREVSNSEQDELNYDPLSGKSVNVIRTFTGKGTIIWGARTLAANSDEWRYIAVRRFYSYVEGSVANSLNTMVYEPNSAITWVKIKAMVTGFLVRQWESGALVGANMREAFFVEVGKKTTLQSDINNGIINVRIGMAVARPAEFIIIEFSHKTI
ncbi:MAG: phage tail sheath C-terminal domain-containing protein [Cyclobacteriaceae bacterium]